MFHHPQPLPISPGQESVWQYPRPPRLEKINQSIKVVAEGETIAHSTNAYRVLETSHPPVYYLPPADIEMQYLIPTSDRSFCEWKGNATYFDLQINSTRIVHGAWAYNQPTPDFSAIAGYLAFYAQLMEACYVDEELATPQPGGFYGGWITSKIIGPFKGSPGSWGW